MYTEIFNMYVKKPSKELNNLNHPRHEHPQSFPCSYTKKQKKTTNATMFVDIAQKTFIE